jgi:hypothetical protein
VSAVASPASFGANEQRVGADVVRLQRLAVERRRIVRGGCEVAPIEHEIAVDRREPGCAQRRDQRLPLLDRELRIAVTLQHQIAVQHAVNQRTVEIRLGLPAVFRSQQIERGERGDELHHRRRAHRAVRLMGEERRVRVGRLHDDRDTRHRHTRVEERACDGSRHGGDRDVRRENEDEQCDRASHATATISCVRSTRSAYSSSVVTYGGMK